MKATVIPKKYRLKIYIEGKRLLVEYINNRELLLTESPYGFGWGLCRAVKEAFYGIYPDVYDKYSHLEFGSCELPHYPELNMHFNGYVSGILNYWDCTYQDRLNYLDLAIIQLTSLKKKKK